MTKRPSPNDMRSDVKNPNNPAHAAAVANHIRQVATSQSQSAAAVGAKKPAEPKK